MLRKFAKASETEIWTRIPRRYLSFFAGLHFENEPGLTELDAAEGRRNRLSRRIRRSESANIPWSWARCLCSLLLPRISTLLASSKFVTNRNHFHAIAETGPTGQLHYEGIANGSRLFRPEDKDELDFLEPAMLFYAQESTT